MGRRNRERKVPLGSSISLVRDSGGDTRTRMMRAKLWLPGKREGQLGRSDYNGYNGYNGHNGHNGVAKGSSDGASAACTPATLVRNQRPPLTTLLECGTSRPSSGDEIVIKVCRHGMYLHKGWGTCR